MTSIHFQDFILTDAQKLEFSYLRPESGESGVITFESNQPLPFDPDSIARAIYTLVGKKYEKLKIDLKVSPATADIFYRYITKDVSFLSEDREEMTYERRGSVLNFSGGFDSLAALQLMPPETKLVSMDFGGVFGREREFFSKFNTTTVKTNIVGTEFQLNSWSMMGIAAILTAPVHRSKYMTFGGIMGNTPDTIRRVPTASTAPTFPPFDASGYINAGYVLGISELGTALLIARHMPDTLGESLLSLAASGSTKKYRKTMLASLAIDQLKLDIEVDAPVIPRAPLLWGEHFTTDFAGLYILKHAGREAFDALISGAPDVVFKTADRLSLRFYERLNTTNMMRFPQELWGGLIEKATSAGVLPYTEQDWIELREVRQLFSGTFPAALS